MTQLVSASDYDWDALTALYNRTRSDYLVPMQMTPDKMAEYARIYDVSLNHSFVALDDDTGDQVGVGMLGLRPGRAWITRLGVLPSQRGKGTARRIVEALIAQLRDEDVVCAAQQVRVLLADLAEDTHTEPGARERMPLHELFR